MRVVMMSVVDKSTLLLDSVRELLRDLITQLVVLSKTHGGAKLARFLSPA